MKAAVRSIIPKSMRSTGVSKSGVQVATAPTLFETGFGIYEIGFGIFEIGFDIYETGFGIYEIGFGIFEIGFGIFETGFDIAWFLCNWLFGYLYDLDPAYLAAVLVASHLFAIQFYLKSIKRNKVI